MFGNYLKMAVRNLLKHKGYSTINIAGLAVGMTCCILIGLFIRHELSYDRFHSKADRIYRLVVDVFPPTGKVDNYATSGPGIAPILERDFPEIEHAVRLRPVEDYLVSHGADKFYETFVYADFALFQVFDFQLLAGDKQTVLYDPYSLVLTEETAAKYFGKTDPLGQTLVVDDTLSFKVTGILADPPSNSHFDFDILASMRTLEERNHWMRTTWWSFGGYTYLLLSETTDVTVLGQKLHRISAQYIPQQETGSGYHQECYLQPLTDIHLHSDRRNEWQANSDIKYVTIFSIIAGFILLIACVNFMNLATARSLERTKEIGIRKVVGALRTQLAGQFLGEAVLMAAMAGAISVALATWLLPGFGVLAGRELTFRFFEQPRYLALLTSFSLIVGLIAGSYPAVLLSSFRPVQTIKGKFRATGSGASLRRGLVVFQFAISVTLLIATGVVYKQLNYMRTYDLGYDTEQIVVLEGRGDRQLEQKYNSMKNSLRAIPGVGNTTLSSSVPGCQFDNSVFRIEGNMVDSPYGKDAWNDMRYVIIDPDFIELFDLEMAAGRPISRQFESDKNSAFLLNGSAVRRLDWGKPEDAIGKKIGFSSSAEGQVVGVVKDFHFKSLRSEIEPLILTPRQTHPRMAYISVKLGGGNIPEAMAAIEATWRKHSPGRPFHYFFLDQAFDQQYRSDEQVGRTFGVFTVVAILIACLGLFGLAAYSAQQRTREIGIRKVLGASVANIVTVLSVDFLKLVVLASVVALPVAWLAMRRWLENFAFRTKIGVELFIAAVVLALLIAFVTVAFQAVRAAFVDPVRTLRYE